MLLVWPTQRSGLFVPFLMLFAGGGLLSFAVVFALRGPGLGTALVTALFGGAMLWAALAELIFVRVSGDRLLVRGPLRRGDFRRERCALGVRLQAGGRSSHYVVFVTDGENRADLGQYATERGAERGVERLTSALMGGNVHAPGGKARSEVAATEAEWHGDVARTEQVLAEYYRSPRFRRTPYVVAGVVVLYVLGMAIFAYLSGKKF